MPAALTREARGPSPSLIHPKVSDPEDRVISMGCSEVFRGGVLRLFLDLHQFIQVIPNEMICEKWGAVKREFSTIGLS